jgi:hypothetical protein
LSSFAEGGGPAFAVAVAFALAIAFGFVSRFRRCEDPGPGTGAPLAANQFIPLALLHQQIFLCHFLPKNWMSSPETI